MAKQSMNVMRTSVREFSDAMHDAAQEYLKNHTELSLFDAASVLRHLGEIYGAHVNQAMMMIATQEAEATAIRIARPGQFNGQDLRNNRNGH